MMDLIGPDELDVVVKDGATSKILYGFWACATRCYLLRWESQEQQGDGGR